MNISILIGIIEAMAEAAPDIYDNVKGYLESLKSGKEPTTQQLIQIEQVLKANSKALKEAGGKDGAS